MLTRVGPGNRIADAPPPERVVRILLADHDPISRHVLGSALRTTAGVQVAIVDVNAPLTDWPLDRTDLAVLSVGFERECQIVERLTAARVRVLLAGVRWTRQRLDAALGSGVAGCVVKSHRVDQLVTAVLTTAAGHTVLSPELHRLVSPPGPGAPASAALPVQGQLLKLLTDRELEVVHLFIKGLSTTEVATALHVAPATVKSHVSHMLGKLGARNRLEAVLLVQQALEAA
ncbi:response regulator transcription factor [Kitasatospora sp. NBC_00315]|uniref:response regulator transcription factor n=1 Tax=Kitasatospora sp. NBC_00315 TaxID=2975963 RepID=UPI00324F7A87